MIAAESDDSATVDKETAAEEYTRFCEWVRSDVDGEDKEEPEFALAADLIYTPAQIKQQYTQRFTQCLRKIIQTLNERAAQTNLEKVYIDRETALECCKGIRVTWEQLVGQLRIEYKHATGWRMFADEKRIWIVPCEGFKS